jgi:hypothetical protein
LLRFSFQTYVFPNQFQQKGDKLGLENDFLSTEEDVRLREGVVSDTGKHCGAADGAECIDHAEQ